MAALVGNGVFQVMVLLDLRKIDLMNIYLDIGQKPKSKGLMFVFLGQLSSCNVPCWLDDS